jgi:hypothetical protein
VDIDRGGVIEMEREETDAVGYFGADSGKGAKGVFRVFITKAL